jgi:hypothetical protein
MAHVANGISAPGEAGTATRKVHTKRLHSLATPTTTVPPLGEGESWQRPKE